MRSKRLPLGIFSELRLVENADAGNADYADDGKNNKEHRNSGFCKIYDLESTRSQEVLKKWQNGSPKVLGIAR